ncbi:MAG: Crp/Fnr family transcriptional regulator [Pseudohongiellaceae bacterium]
MMLATPELLKKFSLFQGLPEKDLAYLCANSTVERHSRRSLVFNAGVMENRVCMVFEGRLQGVDFTIDGREVGLFFVEPGDYCGELCVFDGGTQTEHLIALNASVVVLVSAAAIRWVAKENPEITLSLGKKLASRVRQMATQRSILSLPNVLQRVCAQLWLLIPDSHAGERVEIDNLPTHMEIAIMLNLSRETITRVFQQLQKAQIVHRRGQSKLAIEDLARLKEIVEGSDQL